VLEKQRELGFDGAEGAGYDESLFGVDRAWLIQGGKEVMDRAEEGGVDGELVVAQDIDQAFLGKECGVPAHIIVDGKEEIGFLDGLGFAGVGINEVIKDAGIVGAAGLVLADGAEARGVFPFLHNPHGPNMFNELFVRVPEAR
jgi:hypothetical protein